MSENPKETNKEAVVTVRAVIDAGRSLAQLLRLETAFMNSMQINEVNALQDRKLKLTTLLERYKRYFAKNPQTFVTMTAEEKSELQVVNDEFDNALKANHEKLLVARAVNKAIVTCVTSHLVKESSNSIYDGQGSMYNTSQLPISMTLNRMI